MSTKLRENPPDFLFLIYNHKTIDLTESKIRRPVPPKPKRKPHENVFSKHFENKGVEFIDIAVTLSDT